MQLDVTARSYNCFALLRLIMVRVELVKEWRSEQGELPPARLRALSTSEISSSFMPVSMVRDACFWPGSKKGCARSVSAPGRVTLSMVPALFF